MNLLNILFEDEDYVVVDKPSGLLTMPGRGPAAREKNLLALLTQALKRPMFVVHRLDKDASGLILFAKTAQAHRYFSTLFETKGIKKKYLVAVEGQVAPRRGEIDKPIKPYGSGRMGVGFDGKDSLTCYEVLEEYDRATLLEVRLITGRRHQIRVHMYYIKHPVIGDRLYGDQARQAAYPRLMLHSYSLEFADPAGRKRTFKADPPKDFLNVLPFL
ncbi:MAG: RluA family pseudouridine synthase [Elusimicrobiales bacterium]|jgi:RluA family pseudouridine synthase